MKDEEINKLWTDFINDNIFSEYFQSNSDKWISQLLDIKKYILANNCRPNSHCIDNNIKKLEKFIITQTQNYKNCKEIMKDGNIRKLFVDFITDPLYKIYFENIEIHPIDKLKTLNYHPNN